MLGFTVSLYSYQINKSYQIANFLYLQSYFFNFYIFCEKKKLSTKNTVITFNFDKIVGKRKIEKRKAK